MRLPNFKKVIPSETSYKIMDFKSMTKFSLSVATSENSVIDGIFAKPLSAPEIIKKYCVGDKEIFYFTDGYLREKKGDEYAKLGIMKFQTAPEMFVAVYRGRETIFAHNDGYAYSLGYYADSIKMPNGTNFTVYKQGLYFTAGEALLYCKDFFKMQTKKVYGLIRAEEDEGDILALAVSNGKLYVFYENSIYALLTPYDGGDVTFKKLISVDKINKNSVVELNGKMYFIQDNTLCVFDGKRITEKAEIFSDVKLVGRAEHVDEGYLVSANYNGENGYLLYDESALSLQFVKSNSVYFLHDKLGENQTCVWQSCSTNLGKDGIKTLSGIIVKAGVKCKVMIIGDNAKRVFNVNGEAHIRLCMCAEKFAVKIMTTERGLNLTQVEFLYRT